ncbi:MAG: carbohydrate-binding protein, partial [Burkholderiales bacterium]|nr:carbohydrate-binding protein [Opitutaceae bacterium]
VKLELTSDDDGWFNAGDITAGDWMEYQLNVATAGTYTVSVRVVEGAANLRITQNGAELAKVSVPKAEGEAKGATGKATLRLAAGRQTIRVEAVTGGFGLNWLEFMR